MAWTNSKVFREFLADAMRNAVAYDLDGDSFKCALYNNTTAPDNDVTAANTVYNVDQWVVANEVSQAVQWPAGGVALASVVLNSGTADVVFWDAADTSSGSAATLANVFGCLNYDTTVSSKGICYNYFGGTNSVTNGTLTVVWHANGIWRATL